jgi:hypothetical protein
VIWYLLIGVAIGFLLGKLDAIRLYVKWVKSLGPEDAKYVHELMHPEDRWKRNAEHDISISR